MILHDYFRSSAAFRVRIALNLKGLARRAALRPPAQGRAALGRVPRAEPPGPGADADVGSGALTQSLAIIEYLGRDASAAAAAARRRRPGARGCARLRSPSPATSIRSTTCACWATCGMRSAPPKRATSGTATGSRGLRGDRGAARARGPGRYCHGDAPTLADICLVPAGLQRAAPRHGTSPWPRIARHPRRMPRRSRLAPPRSPPRQPDADK